MSKIGRRPIDLASVQVEVNGQEILIAGKNNKGTYHLPEDFKAQLVDGDKKLKITCEDLTAENKMQWGLHRALLANKIQGIASGFERELNINGLGFKGALAGNKIIFSLGYSHKIEFPLPDAVKVEIDKSGQNIKVRGADKELVGTVCSKIRSLRPPEPYKGTGIKLSDEIISRKAGKTKAA